MFGFLAGVLRSAFLWAASTLFPLVFISSPVSAVSFAQVCDLFWQKCAQNQKVLLCLLPWTETATAVFTSSVLNGSEFHSLGPPLSYSYRLDKTKLGISCIRNITVSVRQQLWNKLTHLWLIYTYKMGRINPQLCNHLNVGASHLQPLPLLLLPTFFSSSGKRILEATFAKITLTMQNLIIKIAIWHVKKSSLCFLKQIVCRKNCFMGREWSQQFCLKAAQIPNTVFGLKASVKMFWLVSDTNQNVLKANTILETN